MLGMTVMNRRCARCSRSSSRLRARGPVSEEPYVAIRRFLETQAFGLVNDRTRVHIGLGCRYSHANADQHRSCGQDKSLHFLPLEFFCHDCRKANLATLRYTIFSKPSYMNFITKRIVYS